MFDENTLIGRIAKGDYPTEIVETKYGMFEIKYPSGYDWNVIAKIQASSLGNMPLNSLDPESVLMAKRDATLSVLIKTYPDNFPRAFKNEGIVNFPDEEVKNELYKSFNTFFLEKQNEIRGESK